MYTPHDGQVTYHHDRLPLSLQLNDDGSGSLNHVHIRLSPDARVPARPIRSDVIHYYFRRRRKKGGEATSYYAYDCMHLSIHASHGGLRLNTHNHKNVFIGIGIGIGIGIINSIFTMIFHNWCIIKGIFSPELQLIPLPSFINSREIILNFFSFHEVEIPSAQLVEEVGGVDRDLHAEMHHSHCVDLMQTPHDAMRFIYNIKGTKQKKVNRTISMLVEANLPERFRSEP
jgi:hypothetical protein